LQYLFLKSGICDGGRELGLGEEIWEGKGIHGGEKRRKSERRE